MKKKTRMVSVRQLREHLSQYLREAQEKKIHFVIMRHAVPVAHIIPAVHKRQTMEELLAELAQARAELGRGEGISQEEMERLVGLR